jgi:predicted adenylyl cyclase CyaB
MRISRALRCFVRNLEFKARLSETRTVLARAREMGADLWGDLRQTDAYFAVGRGRLKLRETAGFQAELIYYQREENGAGRPSDYEIAHSADAEALRSVLSHALGVLATVKKRRTLLVLDSTRIHLDNVEGLGSFIELETPVRQDEAEAQVRIDALVSALGFDWNDCVRASYLDLVLEQQEAPA